MRLTAPLRTRVVTAMKENNLSLRKLEKATRLSYVTLHKFVSKNAPISEKTEQKLVKFLAKQGNGNGTHAEEKSCECAEATIKKIKVNNKKFELVLREVGA